MSHFDPLEFKRYLYLGGRVSAKHRFFRDLSKLGYDEARKLAILKFLRWYRKYKNRKKIDKIKVFEKLLELKGMAELMPTLKELTRISMILGDTTEIETY